MEYELRITFIVASRNKLTKRYAGVLNRKQYVSHFLPNENIVRCRFYNVTLMISILVLFQ